MCTYMHNIIVQQIPIGDISQNSITKRDHYRMIAMVVCDGNFDQ